MSDTLYVLTAPGHPEQRESLPNHGEARAWAQRWARAALEGAALNDGAYHNDRLDWRIDTAAGAPIASGYARYAYGPGIMPTHTESYPVILTRR